MITREQFFLQMDRLRDAFGDHKFPDQRESMMWEASEGQDYATVIRVVDMFIRNSKAAPLPGEFSDLMSKEALSSGKKKFHLGEIQPKEIAKCHDCGDSGFIRLVRNEEFEDWAKWERGSAPCHCDRGRQVSRSKKYDFGPQFSERWEKSYSVISSYPEGKA